MYLFNGLIAALCCGMVTGAEAATVTYQYLGGLGRVSNVASPADRVPFNTGVLTVNRDALAGGESLANRTISYTPYEDDPDPSAWAVAFDFALGTGSEDVAYSLSFDADENLTSWWFGSSFMVTPSDWEHFSIGSRGDAYYRLDRDGNAADRIARDFLGGLGMHEGTPEYSFNYCGGWAGPEFGCGDLGEASEAWAATFIALGAGEWFRDDPFGFDEAAKRARHAALVDPARSYHDLSPSAVPLPAPFVLLIGGIAGLALVRRRMA